MSVSVMAVEMNALSPPFDAGSFVSVPGHRGKQLIVAERRSPSCASQVALTAHLV